MELGKLPPQATDIESAVIGAILLDSTAMLTVSDTIKTPQAFYKEENALIYTACQRLQRMGQNIDLLTVTEELRRSGDLDRVGGAYAVMDYTNRLTSSAHVETHAKIIQEKFLLRRIIHLTNVHNAQAYSDSVDVFKLLEDINNDFIELSQFKQSKEAVKISELYYNQIKAFENPVKGGNINTLFYELDLIIGGFELSQLITIAARPSLGKTAFALTLAHHFAAYQSIPCAFFSMEMSCEELTARYMALSTDTPLSYIRNKDVRGRYLTAVMENVSKVENTPLYIDDTGGLTISELAGKVRKLKLKYNIQIIFVDYIGLMTPTHGNGKSRENEVGEISRGLKKLAKNMDILIFDLSQLSRGVESRENKRPVLSDLRDSGAIEQDSNAVIFLYREDYYNPNVPPDMAGITEVIVAKNRNGSLGTAIVKFRKELTKFENNKTQYEENKEYAIYGTEVGNKELGQLF